MCWALSGWGFTERTAMRIHFSVNFFTANPSMMSDQPLSIKWMVRNRAMGWTA
jgi:hypothetical protein